MMNGLLLVSWNISGREQESRWAVFVVPSGVREFIEFDLGRYPPFILPTIGCPQGVTCMGTAMGPPGEEPSCVECDGHQGKVATVPTPGVRRKRRRR